MHAPRIAIAFATGIVTSTAHAQLVEWKEIDGGNGHFYEVVIASGGIIWDDARLAAEAAGGYLATITTGAENDFVFSLIDSPEYWIVRQDQPGFIGAFIGGFQGPGAQEPAGDWEWVTGEAFTFTSWAPGEPNDAGGQDFLAYNSFEPVFENVQPTWGDGGGGINLGGIDRAYVIEHIPSPGTAPSLLVLMTIGVCARRRI